MAIREEGVSVITVGDLLRQRLRIPHYQRPYSWRSSTALQLLDDIKDAFDNSRGKSYVLGTVILHDRGEWLDVVDGQQRLLTLRLIQLLRQPGSNHAGVDTPVSRVRRALVQRTQDWTADEWASLLDFLCAQCQFVRVVTEDIDEAFRVFDSQNYRGKPLAPHDLLKAHHLREMRGESEAMLSAVVESWEKAGDDDLDRLFSVYLYRIARWSRGQSATRFTAQDIGMFKSIPPANSRSPNARYHLAAQAAIPMLTAWDESALRDAGRTRFQLDAPVPAGRAFFEMVTFMLSELRQLRKEAFSKGWESFASSDPETLEELPGRSRYRYVTELYMAALLYWTNKFADDEFLAARKRLFAWAYTLRVRLLRVQYRSIDIRARGDGNAMSAFTLLRDAMSGRIVHQLPASSRPYNDRHERRLADLLEQLGAR